MILAVITGANGGLGKEIASSLWNEGFSLILIGRNKPELHALKGSLTSRTKQTCEYIICDLSNPKSLNRFIENKFKKLNKIDVLINNAAIHGPIGPFFENQEMDFKNLFQINFFSPVSLMSAAIPLMKKYGGSIINISGGGAASPRHNFSAYASSKTALVRFSETAALEVKKFGIRVNCVAPGMMPTKLLSEVIACQDISDLEELTLARKTFENNEYSYDDIVKLILFLASKDSKDISGKLISAVWDNWKYWCANKEALNKYDLYTLRRITARDKGLTWGDK